MADCSRVDPLVTPFVDGELVDADRRAVEEHLRRCPPCHSRVAAERAVHELLQARRASLGGAHAPDALHARCSELAARARGMAAHPESALKTQLDPRAVALPRRLAPYALAASLVVVVGGAFVYQATDKSARVLAAELVADHAKCFALNGALGTHQAAAAVEQSMAASFDWRMRLPDNPSRVGLELVGARPCLYGEGRIAHIMYRHRGQPMSLFMLPETARAQQLVEVFGHEAAIWCANNRTFVLVSREPRQEVAAVASFVQTALH
jgi:anti-sigma factor RsiW